MAYLFYKRNADNTFYATDIENKVFKVVSDPEFSQDSVVCNVLKNNVAEFNTIQLNAQISANQDLFTTIQEIDFNNRIFLVKSYIEDNL
jgi:hypothetical protein